MKWRLKKEDQVIDRQNRCESEHEKTNSAMMKRQWEDRIKWRGLCWK